jgi:cob(I)alamin adenosyltransferase
MDAPKEKAQRPKRSGDDGKTCLRDGSVVYKFDHRLKAVGDVEELSAIIATFPRGRLETDWYDASLPAFVIPLPRFKPYLDFDIQTHLAVICITLTCDYDKTPYPTPFLTDAEVAKLEVAIDAMTKEIAESERCIVGTVSGQTLRSDGGRATGGNATTNPSPEIHVARAICRRAERRVAKLCYVAELRLSLYGDPLPKPLATSLKYLNRLGELLLVFARKIAKDHQIHCSMMQ